MSPPLALGISVVGKSQIFDENKRVNEFSIEIGYTDINARVAKKPRYLNIFTFLGFKCFSGVLGFLNYIFCKALLGVAYLR